MAGYPCRVFSATLRLLFATKLQDFSNKPLSVSEALYKTTQIVISPTEIVDRDSIESEIDIPSWHRKIFDESTSLDALSEEEQQGATQFYDKLDQIRSKHEKIKKLGHKVVRRTNLEEQLEALVTEVLSQGNPLKKT